MSLNVELARHNMVEQQIRPWDVLDARVLEALSTLRREDFVPAPYRSLAFADIELPLPHGEVMMKPVVEGRVLQAMTPSKTARVLEIGTGSGFLTACLGYLAGEVVSVEQHEDFVVAARARIAAAGLHNVCIEHGDALGSDAHAFMPQAAFDVMVVTGAVATLPPRWREWIKPGGTIFVVVGESPGQRAMLYRRGADGIYVADQALFETDLPYLNGAAPTACFVL